MLLINRASNETSAGADEAGIVVVGLDLIRLGEISSNISVQTPAVTSQVDQWQ